MNHLLARVIRVRRIGGSSQRPVDEVAKRVKEYLASGRIYRNHVLEGSRTGAHRRVDFFVNSGANVVLDTVRLDLARAEEIVRRGDAEAFKILDLSTTLHDLSFIVLCATSTDALVEEATTIATQALLSSGAEVLKNVDDAAARLIESANR